MTSLIARFTSAPIRLQIAALLIATQFIAHTITINLMAGIMGLNGVERGSFAVESVAPMLTLLAIAGNFEGKTRDDVIAAAMAEDSRFSMSPTNPGRISAHGSTLKQEFRDAIRKEAPAPWQNPVYGFVKSDAAQFLPFAAVVGASTRLADGTWLVFTQNTKSTWQIMPLLILSLAISVLALPLTFLAIWSGSILLAPLKSLVEGAQRFSTDLDPQPIKQRGARELRQAAAAMNEMQRRIRALVDDRAQALAAIAHDIRTPLTRLRLHAEAVDDAKCRDEILDELTGMEKMVNSALSFLRSQKNPVVRVPVDVSILAQSIADELTDQGSVAEFTGPERLVIRCDPDLVRRALENLANNAVFHGGSVAIAVRQNLDGTVAITVSDNGPGIPAKQREAVMEPFFKVDRARTGEHAENAFGLGLSITRNIARAHGGNLILSDNRPTGLVATMTLPCVEFSKMSDKAEFALPA